MALLGSPNVEEIAFIGFFCRLGLIYEGTTFNWHWD